MSEEKKEKDKEKIIIKRDISGVRERREIRETHEESGVKPRTAEKKKKQEK